MFQIRNIGIVRFQIKNTTIALVRIWSTTSNAMHPIQTIAFSALSPIRNLAYEVTRGLATPKPTWSGFYLPMGRLLDPGLALAFPFGLQLENQRHLSHQLVGPRLAGRMLYCSKLPNCISFSFRLDF